MSEIARFYGFKVSVDSSFSVTPNVMFDYEDDDIEDIYDLEEEQFSKNIFPKYLRDVVQEWLADNLQSLKDMWANKEIVMLPDWE